MVIVALVVMALVVVLVSLGLAGLGLIGGLFLVLGGVVRVGADLNQLGRGGDVDDGLGGLLLDGLVNGALEARESAEDRESTILGESSRSCGSAPSGVREVTETCSPPIFSARYCRG